MIINCSLLHFTYIGLCYFIFLYGESIPVGGEGERLDVRLLRVDPEAPRPEDGILLVAAPRRSPREDPHRRRPADPVPPVARPLVLMALPSTVAPAS